MRSPIFEIAPSFWMYALAVTLARELALWEIETLILAPGASTRPLRSALMRASAAGCRRLSLTSSWRTPIHRSSRAVVAIAAAPLGRRPFCVVVDLMQDGAAVGCAFTDRLRTEMLQRRRLEALL